MMSHKNEKSRKIKNIAAMLVLALLFFVQMVSAQTTPKTESEANKKLAIAFYQQLFGDKDVSAIDKYIADGYIQHNPTVADGKEALRKALQGWFSHDATKTKIDLQRSAADGDLVFLHTKIKSAAGKDVSLIDIFRFKNSKIVEHWDVRQEVPENAANSHPMF